MATRQVPGYGEAYQDRLVKGVWAEADDGVQALVEAINADGVVTLKTVCKGEALRHDIPLLEFQEEFSDTGWLWHDKTPAPKDLLAA